ncbi:acyltransferase family protein [Cyanobium gracile]|uniref:Acyltransferase family protein n=1 Tax=Cyanobium gracile UHCC 0281 TaxID=3110309 RepID=A0ABU5SVJ3_9CYAN|nr:acyltransferase family protein [Cyanobium gracile]MEA5442062.1 acyltransferase family protein [Cyanobium gracile UHCC 0281]
MVAATTSSPVAASAKASAPGRFAYRPDIDALRGAAMLAVLVFHLNKGWLPGGFTGVDIFFVISGYVVMGSLLGQASKPFWPRLGNFYLRRVRRLLPNLLACLAVTSLAVAALIPPLESGPYFNAALKALFGWSNNFLMGQIDYFNPDADLNPFLHTWSLGVEQQFYLVFPLLLLGIGYGVRRSVPLLTALTVLSVGASWWWTQNAPMAAFFLMPSRLWELTSGSLLLVAQRRGLLVAPWLKGRWLRLAGAALLLWAVVATSEREGFPVPGVLPAVLGTLLVLQAGPGEGGRFLPGRWLERGLLTAGLLSYSLYLWHWPVIVLLRWTLGMETWWQYGLAVVGSVVLAVGAYGLVEQPVRRHPLTWWWEMVLALLAVVGLWLGIDALHHQFRGKLFIGPDPDPVPFRERIHTYDPYILNSGIKEKNCTVPIGKPYGLATRPNYDLCQKPGKPGAREIFLLGDSHALHLVPMLDSVTSRTGQRLTLAFQMACFLDTSMVATLGNVKFPVCQDLARGEMERALERLKPGDIVMISSWLNSYLSGLSSSGKPSPMVVEKHGRRINPPEARAIHVANLRRFAKQLAARDLHLVLTVDTPMLLQKPMECRPKPGQWEQCSPEPQITARMQQTIRETLTEAAAGLSNVHLFDPSPFFLDAEGRVTPMRPDGTLLFSDDHHLSVSGSRSLAGPFERFLQQQGLTSPGPTPSAPSP